MTSDNGGPAFPGDKAIPTPNGYHTPTGMTLRDYFAGQALASGEVSLVTLSTNDAKESLSASWARGAYMVADEMLAERNKAEGT